MRRRGFLTGALAALAAGCAGRSPGGETRSPAGTPSSTESPPALVDSHLRVLESGCGKQVDEASVSFDPDAPAVGVEGTIWGSDTCHTARLADATYAPDADRLTVRVVSVRPETTETPVCGQCIVEIEYAATCSFSGGLPGTVRVVHGTGERERVVATAER
ncbi:MAG: hypothetical protein ABEH78_03700 [Haloferacaceae archaeon]